MILVKFENKQNNRNTFDEVQNIDHKSVSGQNGKNSSIINKLAPLIQCKRGRNANKNNKTGLKCLSRLK